jgi:hypothetical protein
MRPSHLWRTPGLRRPAWIRLPTRAKRSTARRWSLAKVRPASADRPLLIVFLLASVFYIWTDRTSIDRLSHSYYYLLADSFLHGHTYLPIHVPAGLKALTDPYNPVANAPFGAHDLAYYKGRFYLSWMPTPVLTLYLPLRLLGIEMTDATAVPIFSIAALAFAILFLRLIVRRLLPQARNWTLVLGVCALAFATAIPFLLRRPAIYEVAIAGGACFAMAGLYLLARGMLHEPAPRLRLLAAASLCMGLAFGSRAPLLAGGLAFVAVAVVICRRRDLGAGVRRRAIVALLAPLAVCVLLVAGYNVSRFGSPTQFGVEYVLAGVDQRNEPTFQLSYVTPGIYNFAIAPPRLALTFPHVFLPPPPGYPGVLPQGYAGRAFAAEPTGGVIPMAPIVLFGLAAVVLWRRRRTLGPQPALIVGGLALLGIAIIFGLSFTLFATTERYEVDFDLLMILAGVLGWMFLLAMLRGRWPRRVVAIAGAIAIAWSCFTGMAVSITGYYNSLYVLHPSAFHLLEDVTSPFATLPTILLGHPVIVRLEGPGPIILPPVNYTTLDENGVSTYLGIGPMTLTVLSPRSENLYLRANVGPGFQPTRGPLLISIASPGIAPITQTCTPGVCLLYIHVHWGLNRIVLDTAGGPTGGLAIGLGAMVLSEFGHSAHARAPRALPAASRPPATPRQRAHAAERLGSGG